MQADTPFADMVEKTYPTVLLNASGRAVGLPKGYMGNSEVGHMTMGLGRVQKQLLTRINDAIEDKTFFQNKEILKAIQNTKENDSKLHLMCLLQDAGVHAHISHLFAVLDYAKKEGLKKDDVLLHLFTDGRDDKPTSGIGFLAEVAEYIEQKRIGKVVTISGRYFAMDRNKKYERTKKAYEAIFDAKGEKFKCGLGKLDELYKKNITDEFIEPMVKVSYSGVKDKDSIFFLNFRKDRARQLTEAIIDKNFFAFDRKQKDIYFLSMARYDKKWKNNVVFEDIEPKNTLTEILDKNNKKQLRISETEKYAHVTFFFDGGKEFESKNIDKVIVPSPNVATYDLKPEMSSHELTEKTIEEIKTEKYDFILINYPNADMVGHTGDFEATKKAVESVDRSVKKVTEKGLEKNYIILLTADHGNAESVSHTDTKHTSNKVFFSYIANDLKNQKNIFKKGEFGLSNIAKTILDIFEIKSNDKMDESLLK